MIKRRKICLIQQFLISARSIFTVNLSNQTSWALKTKTGKLHPEIWVRTHYSYTFTLRPTPITIPLRCPLRQFAKLSAWLVPLTTISSTNWLTEGTWYVPMAIHLNSTKCLSPTRRHKNWCRLWDMILKVFRHPLHPNRYMDIMCRRRV